MWADSAEASKTRAALAWVVMIVISITDRASTLIDILIWTQMVVVRRVHTMVAVANVVHVDVGAYVGLAELIQDGSGSLGIDG